MNVQCASKFKSANCQLLCGRPVALEFSTKQRERSGSWQGQLQTFAEDASLYTVLKDLAY